jgi:hypothetical protein
MGGAFNIQMKVSANDTLCVFLLKKNELDLFTCFGLVSRDGGRTILIFTQFTDLLF